MEQKSKTYIRPIVIVMLFAFITIGYAYLTSVLNINGSTLIKNPTWDVHFENVQVKDGSVTGEQVTQEPEIDTNRTTVSFHVNLKKPGDYYEFTVDAVNAGTIDAMINTITDFDLTTDQLKYLETSVTYEDGEEVQEKQQLLAGDFAVYKIIVSFKKDISEDDLPSTPDQLDLIYSVEYVQRDDTSIRRKAENVLYNILKEETESGSGLALKYTGEHQDSMDETLSTKEIYHWYASNATNATVINDKNNIIFANYCWKIIRTTDTGGVKVIYNGIPDEGKCNSTGINQQIGSSKFNLDKTSLADVGYMYNKKYSYTYNMGSSTLYPLGESTINTNYYYADSYSYDNNTNSYSLVDPYQISQSSDYSFLIGKYTIRQTSPNANHSSVTYIAGVIGNYMYSISLSDNHDISYFDDTFIYGNDYIDNGDGTYTIVSPTINSKLDWISFYSNLAGKYLCINGIDNTCSDLILVIYTDRSKFRYNSILDVYKFASDVTYDSSTGLYTLSDDSVSFWDYANQDNASLISNHHYTCLNSSGVCDGIIFIFYVDKPYLYYVGFNNGKKIDDVLYDMLHEPNVNSNDSIIKKYIEDWFFDNLEEYSLSIEDTVFCDNRTVANYEASGWSPNGSIKTKLFFDFSSNNLSCPYNVDKFSIYNDSAKLRYPIGMLTENEIVLSGNDKIYNTGVYYWLLSPGSFSQVFTSFRASARIMTNSGTLSEDMYQTRGVRPVISLRPGIMFESGDGSKEYPYYIGNIYSINVNSSLFNLDKFGVPGRVVSMFSNDYIVTSFKLNGVLINGDSFIMPNENVNITDIQYIDANYSITSNDNSISFPASARYNTDVKLSANNYKIISFKLNGDLINGDSFVMPSQDVIISDVIKVFCIVVESEHNPYADNIDNVVYYENTFDGASSINIELTYQTESTNYDWIYLYDNPASSTPFNNKKYGGSTKTTENIVINSNYLKIVFRSDVSGCNYYGFKAEITPIYE